jgi:hypothetical protein
VVSERLIGEVFGSFFAEGEDFERRLRVKSGGFDRYRQFTHLALSYQFLPY